MNPHEPLYSHDATAAVSRRRAPLLALALSIAMLISVSLAGPAAAAHVECGDTITDDTVLDSDVGPCPGEGLVVTGDNITLDLGGHTVFAANGEGDNAGIRLADVTGVTVQNGTVTGFDAGVVIEDGSGNTVQQISAVDNINDMLSPPCLLGEGIAILDSSDNTVTRSELVHNGPFGGVSVVGDSDGNVISRNEIHDNNVFATGGGCGRGDQDEGVRIEGPGADDNVVDRNTVTGSLLAGIGLHGYVCQPLNPDVPPENPNTGNVVTRNTVTGTAGSLSDGIAILQQGPATVVCPAFAATIERNIVTDNEGAGIFVSANSHDNQINHNVVERNQFDGIHLGGPRMGTNFDVLEPATLDLVSPDLPPYEEGTDYQVMFGSGSGDTTATLRAIDIAIPNNDPINPNPVDTSTSGCEPEDYTAAGFQEGDIALIQRGTCTFVSKVALAEEMGASAVIMFNEGQSGRTSFNFGSVGGADIPVVTTTYAVGQELYNLTQDGPVTIRVAAETQIEQYEAAPGAYDNVLVKNAGQNNAEFDGFDGNDDCDNNQWDRNQFGTVNQPCVAAGGSGKARGESGDAPGRQDGGGQEHNRGQGNS